ncbi:hypothetical protein H4S07_006882, partial [Coemansia furcata]
MIIPTREVDPSGDDDETAEINDRGDKGMPSSLSFRCLRTSVLDPVSNADLATVDPGEYTSACGVDAVLAAAAPPPVVAPPGMEIERRKMLLIGCCCLLPVAQ